MIAEIAGPSLFDMVIFLGCLLAMFLSLMPKKFAISICLGVSLLGIAVNTAAMYEWITVKMVYSLAGVVEFFSGLLLLLYVITLKMNSGDKVFFLLMALFLFLSCNLTMIFIPILFDGYHPYHNYLTFEMYQGIFHTIAVLHVLIMLVYSDGIRSSITNIRGFWIRNYAYYSNR